MRFSRINLKNEQNNCSKCSAFASSAAFALFISNSVVFVDGMRKNISCPGRTVPYLCHCLNSLEKWPKRVLEFNFSVAVAILYLITQRYRNPGKS